MIVEILINVLQRLPVSMQRILYTLIKVECLIHILGIKADDIQFKFEVMAADTSLCLV